jgi:hypothetical protein
MTTGSVPGEPLLRRAVSFGRALALFLFSAAVGVVVATCLQQAFESAGVDFAQLPLSPWLRQMLEAVIEDWLKLILGIAGGSLRLRMGLRDGLLALAVVFVIGLGIGLGTRIPVPELRTFLIAAAVLFALVLVVGTLYVIGEVLTRNIDWGRHLVFVPGWPDLDDEGPYDEMSTTMDWLRETFGSRDE